MKKQKLVMVGNGMAGCRTLEELLKLEPELYDITVFGAEPHPNYNRILLSPVLAGEMTLPDIVLNDHAWYRDNGIMLHAGKKVVKIDRKAQRVIAEDGTEAEYDRLLLATGSSPFILPVPGKDLPGVIAYRDIADTEAMIEAAKTHTHAVVIGAGLLGLEAANGLRLRGMDVTVVHLADWIMERQLDKTAADLLKQSLEAKGLKFLLGKQTEALVAGESGRVAAIRFRTAKSSRPIWWSWRSASVPTPRWPNPPAFTPCAESWSMTPCKPTTPRSTPSANARRTGEPPMASSRRCSSRPRSAPTILRSLASVATKARSLRPNSRSPVSTSSRPAISPGATRPRKSSSPTRRAACTRNLSFRVTNWLVP